MEVSNSSQSQLVDGGAMAAAAAVVGNGVGEVVKRKLPELMLSHLLQVVAMLENNLYVTDASCITPGRVLLSARSVKGPVIQPETAELQVPICNQWPWCAMDAANTGITGIGARTRLPTQTTMLVGEHM